MAEPVEMLFVLWLEWAQGIVLDGVQIPHGNGQFWVGRGISL